MSLGRTLSSEWEPALVDAGIPPENARLYVFEGRAPEHAEAAILLYPGTEAVNDERFPVKGKQLSDANTNRDLFRIGTYEDREAVVLAARLRHELEHARQYSTFGMAILQLADLLIAAVGHRFGGVPGAAVYYNLVPIEQDANAAAARYAFSRYPDDARRLLDDRDPEAGLLRSKLNPESHHTLPKRMVAFAIMFADTIELHAHENNKTPESLLNDIFPGAGTLYAEWVAISFG